VPALDKASWREHCARVKGDEVADLNAECTGFGGGLFAVPLLTMFYEPRFIVPVLSLVVYLLNLIMLVEGRKKVRWKKVSRIVIGSFIGLPVGVSALKYLDQDVIRLLISVVTFVLGILFLFGFKPDKDEFRATLIGCFAFNGIVGNSLYFINGLFTPLNLKIVLFGILPALAGAMLGIRVKNILPEEKFARITVILVVLIGIIGTVRAVSLLSG